MTVFTEDMRDYRTFRGRSTPETPCAIAWGVSAETYGTPRMPPMASELGQLRARHRDPHPLGTEIDNQRGLILDRDDPAEAVLVVRYLVMLGELLGRRSGGRRAKGTCGQEAPGGGVGRFHHYQYAPGARHDTRLRRHESAGW
jgi:hypothetical protein